MSTMYEEGTGEALATFVDLGATIAALSDLERRHLIAGDVAPVGVITGLVEKGLVFRTKGRWWLTELGGSVREALAAPADAPLLGGVEHLVTYTNYKGETAERRIRPISLRFGSSAWHREPQWLLLAYDVDKGERREFALADMKVK